MEVRLFSRHHHYTLIDQFMYHYVLRLVSRGGADVELVRSIASCADKDDVHTIKASAIG